jgi:hypothetical protein
MKALRRSQSESSKQKRKPKFNESRLTKLFERFLTGHGLVGTLLGADD